MTKKFHSCIVLDLDETLFHTATSISVDEKLKKEADITFKMENSYYYIKVRPYVASFLKNIYENFDHVAIWTAAEKKYADKVVKKIFTPDQYEKLLFFYSRKNCVVNKNGRYTKPLDKVFNNFTFLNKHNTVILDNTNVSSENKYNKTILIKDFIWNTKDDKELKKLMIRKKVESLKSINNFKNKLK
jgi:hypothetical protein